MLIFVKSEGSFKRKHLKQKLQKAQFQTKSGILFEFETADGAIARNSFSSYNNIPIPKSVKSQVVNHSHQNR